jgi:hypothetical protein
VCYSVVQVLWERVLLQELMRDRKDGGNIYIWYRRLFGEW